MGNASDEEEKVYRRAHISGSIGDDAAGEMRRRGGDPKDGVEGEQSERVIGTTRQAAEDDADSKEPRLTLMEEVLLLGLKDREVRKRMDLIGNSIQRVSCFVRRELNSRTSLLSG